MIKRVALFDFDNTVANGDTITRLLKYDLMKSPWHLLYFIKVAWYYGLYLLHLSSFEKAKEAILFPLRFMDQPACEDFYHQHVEVYYYPNVVEEMRKKQEDGYIVILCTASSETYMRYQQLPVNQLIGTCVQYDPNKKTIKIIGKNCKGEEKIQRIMTYLESQDIQIDYENSYGYSDSNADIPMLSLVYHKKRVLLHTGEIIDFKE